MARRGEPGPRGVSELDPERARVSEIFDPLSGERVTVPHPNLQNVAQGYRQQRVLADLLCGFWVANPAYWQNGRRVRPRRNELASWQHFRERLTDAGYALETHREAGCAEGDEVYRLHAPVEMRA